MDLKSQTGVRIRPQQSVYLVKPLFLVAILFFCLEVTFGQENFSPILYESGFKNKILSIVVKDSLAFHREYFKKLRVTPSNKLANHFYVVCENEGVAALLKRDQNVLFIDQKRTPHTEGNYDLLNPSINKLNIIRK